MADWAGIRRDRVLFADDAALVLDKPAGLAVTGERHDTDLVRLAADAGETLFPAHRIDKVTSGAVLFARELRHHGDLTRQFNRRTVGKAYLAATPTTGLPDRGVIDLPLSVGRKSRVRVAADRDRIRADGDRWSVAPDDVFTHVRTYPSVTTFATVWADERHTLLVVRPLTGRRHQIRVHLAWIGHQLAGDPLFDRSGAAGRTLLHSWLLAFDAAWLGGRRIEVAAVPGNDFWTPLGGRPDGVLATARQRLAGLADLVGEVPAEDDEE
ncbi:MAG TPA: RNA pseudouridine synthase [Pseudonocardiaceae bacterium]|nr:RNA pseudouridine synthase [Pseudonocardiaceae bacterium]